MENHAEIWFSDVQTDNVKLNIRLDKQLFSAISEYQRIDVFQSPAFGRFVALDGDVIFSEADEFIYNEMVTHVPMAVHPHVKKVLHPSLACHPHHRRRRRRRGAGVHRLS